MCCLQNISREVQLFPAGIYDGLAFEFTPGEGCNRYGTILYVAAVYKSHQHASMVYMY